MRILNGILKAALIALAVCACVAALHLSLVVLRGARSFGEHFETKVSSPSLAEVSALAHVKFPAKARLLHSHFIRRWDNWDLYASIEIPRADVTRFAASLEALPGCVSSRTDDLGVTGVEEREHRPGPWWNPSSAERFIAAKAGDTALLISLDSPERALVYLFYVKP